MGPWSAPKELALPGGGRPVDGAGHVGAGEGAADPPVALPAPVLVEVTVNDVRAPYGGGHQLELVAADDLGRDADPGRRRPR